MSQIIHQPIKQGCGLYCQGRRVNVMDLQMAMIRALTRQRERARARNVFMQSDRAFFDTDLINMQSHA